MPKKANFKKIVGTIKAEKPEQKKEPLEKISGKSLEKEIRKFHSKPKAQRDKTSQKFDFGPVSTELREKVNAAKDREKKPAARRVVEKIGKKILGKNAMERVPTGIKGLDNLIEGGFEKGSSVLLVGSSGTGKTLFAQQFLYYGAKDHGEPGIFISFEEERETLYKHSASFGWDFEELEKKGLFKVLQYKPHQVEKLMAEGGGTIKDQIRSMGAKRLVIDSITSYALLFKDEYQKRENILDFFDMLAKWGCTSIIISELPPKLAEIKEGSVGFLTDAIISLYYSKDQEKGIRVHSCEILKMRGTKHTNKMLALGFEKNGLVIYPEVEVF